MASGLLGLLVVMVVVLTAPTWPDGPIKAAATWVRQQVGLEPKQPIDISEVFGLDEFTANNYETVQQIADQIAAETPWACGDLRVLGPNDPNDPITFEEAADCGEEVLLYIHKNQQDTQKALDFASEYAPHYRVVHGTTWSVMCLNDPADLICSELHKALGGDLIEPTPIRP